MAEENEERDFFLGVAMGIAFGLLAGVVVVAALVVFVPEFLGLAKQRETPTKLPAPISRLWDLDQAETASKCIQSLRPL